ncbi:UNVERIFIED_CONTAM: HEAT repeat protein [Acetivibrio alkalicellulosi]
MKNKFNYSCESKDINEKLELIDHIEKKEYFRKNDLEILECLSRDEDSEVRLRIAQILVFSNDEYTEKILVRLLDDNDELVRVNACDSLCNSSSKEVASFLINKATKDKSSLVRTYAIMSVADIFFNITSNNKRENIKLIENMLKREKVKRIKIGYYYALLVLGEMKYFPMLLDEINNRFYINRCSVANTIKDLTIAKMFSNKELLKIKKYFENRLKVEKSLAVKTSIENTMKTVQEYI